MGDVGGKGRTDTRSVSARPMISKRTASKVRKQPASHSEESSQSRRSRQGHNPKLRHDVTSSSGHNTPDETAAADSTRPATDRDMTEIEIVQRTLESLGAPRVSKHEFVALYESPLGASLKLIAERIRGVEEARKSREVIAMYYESKRMKKKGDEEWEYDKHQMLSTKLSAAEKELSVLQKQTDEAQMTYSALERENENLKKEEEHARLRNLYYSVLLKKEDVRTKRMKEIERLLRETSSQKDIPESTCASSRLVVPSDLATRPVLNLTPSNTHDTLALLHAHHTTLARLLSNPAQDPPAILESRLLEAIAGCTGLAKDDDRVQRIYQKYLFAARKKATIEVAPPSPAYDDHRSPERLDVIAERVTEKESRLQSTSDHVIALSAICAQLLQEVTTFSESTASIFTESLQEDREMTRGYIDDLRRLITPKSREVEASHSKPPTPGIPLCEGMTNSQIVTILERNMKKTHDTAKFLDAARINLPNPQGTIDPKISGSIRDLSKDDTRISSENIELLERKLQKSISIGDVLCANLQELQKDAEGIGSLV